MSRANSWNLELDNEGFTYNPKTFSEFSEGEEELIEVADGQRKYMVPSQILSVGEITMEILIKKDKLEYNDAQAWVASGRARDVFVNYIDPEGVTQQSFLLANCHLSHGKRNAFDRSSKSEDTKAYKLSPESISEVL